MAQGLNNVGRGKSAPASPQAPHPASATPDPSDVGGMPSTVDAGVPQDLAARANVETASATPRASGAAGDGDGENVGRNSGGDGEANETVKGG